MIFVPEILLSGNVSTPLATRGAATYSLGSMAAYENLTKSITPFITVMFPNRTVDSAASSGVLLSSVQRELICLRSSDITIGSGQPCSISITWYKGDCYVRLFALSDYSGYKALNSSGS